MKMADTFDLPLKGDAGFLEDMTGDITEYREFGSCCVAMTQAAALAVNNHDKLVEALRDIATGGYGVAGCINFAEEALQELDNE